MPKAPWTPSDFRPVTSALSRRRFSRGLVLASVAPMLGACQGPRRSQSQEFDVLVLGAGLAGLHAARLLEAAGARYQVLEARDRVGGRAYTDFSLPDHPEYGGVQIGDSYRTLLDLATELQLPLGSLPHGRWYRDQLVHFAGANFRPRDWSTHPQNPLPERLRKLLPWQLERHFLLSQNPLERSTDWDRSQLVPADSSTADAVVAAGAPPEALRLMDITGNHDGVDRISALSVWRSQRIRSEAAAAGFRGSAVLLGGTQSLPRAMAAALPDDRIRTGAVVRGVTAAGQGLEVRLDGGETLRARQVICALPAAVVPTLQLDMPLPPARRAALNNLPATAITVLQIDTDPFWERDGLPPMMWTDTALERLFPRVDPASGQVLGLKAFVNGAGARRLDALGGAALQALTLDTLKRVRPALRKAQVVGRQSWAADPFARGAYAAWLPGTVAEVRAAYRESVSLPTGARLHFAGEHTARSAPGLEGALRSGAAAARAALSPAAS